MSTTTDTTTEATTETPAKPLKARYLEQIVRERALERLTERVKKDRQNLDAELRDRYRDEGTTSVRLDHGGKKIGQPTVSITQPTARVTDEPAFTAWVAEHLGEDSVEYIVQVRPNVEKALCKDPEKSPDGGVQWVDSEGEVHTVAGLTYVPGGEIKAVSVSGRDKDALDELLESGDFGAFPLAIEG